MNTRNKRVAHLTSAHPRYDTRIFVKECRSLAASGYQVSLVVADNRGDETKDGIDIYDVGMARGRLQRMTRTTGSVLQRAKALNADIYHLHDPELMPVGLKLKRMGKKVIFDAHEDLPKQLLSKPYLNATARKALSGMLKLYEAWACRRFDAVVTATPFIRDKFLAINDNTVDINNFPIAGELSAADSDWNSKRRTVCYIGGLSATRGIREIVRAMEYVESGTQLQIGGCFSEGNLEQEVRHYKGWERVDELGWLDRQGVRTTLQQACAGLVTLHPTINYLDALPVKMFEYMSAGIPVIASNFPLWMEIIEGNDCGICVDPLDSRSIAQAIDFLAGNSARSREMGKNGEHAVRKHYNWHLEEEKLLNLYSNLDE